MCDIVEDLGHEPRNFFDIDSAKTDLRQEIPDLFVIDMHIGDSMHTTKTFIRDILKNKKHKKIPIIIISAYVTKDDIQRDFPQLDTSNVIEKPASVKTISEKIEYLLIHRN
jgi:response regulator RpfG family c-di-GMP phosphodiesterase